MVNPRIFKLPIRFHYQHHANPAERKERRRLVRVLGRRQAVRHIKAMRQAAKVVRHG